MNIKSWGRFFNDTPEATGETAMLLQNNVLFSRNEDGVDFYALQRQFAAGSVIASIDDDGLITGAGYSPDGMFPSNGLRLVEVSGPDMPSTLQEIVGKVVDLENLALLPKPVNPVPYSITPTQAKLALHDRGLLDDVEALVASHPYRPVQIYFDNATVWERNNPYVVGLGYELGLSEDDMDALFIAAARK